MLNRLKFPLLYVLEFCLWLPLMAGFYICVAFLAATPIASLDLHGKSLPSHWEAAVPNHGKFLQGYIISNHPATFALGVALLLGAAIIIYPIRNAQTLHAEAAGAATGKFKVAHFAVLVGLAATCWFVITHVLVGVNPA